MKNSKKKIPRFKSEDDEREFWASRDSTDYLDWTQAKRRADFQRLHPTLKTISLRLPAGLIAELKILANKRDVPYQSLLKLFLTERVKEEMKPAARRVA
jgi:predicted DNA binding CopG/RHH family protein